MVVHEACICKHSLSSAALVFFLRFDPTTLELPCSASFVIGKGENAAECIGLLKESGDVISIQVSTWVFISFLFPSHVKRELSFLYSIFRTYSRSFQNLRKLRTSKIPFANVLKSIQSRFRCVQGYIC